MTINYIQATRTGGYGKLVSTDPNPNSREFFREIIKVLNLKLNLGLDLRSFQGADLEQHPRGFQLHQFGIELHLRRTWGTHEFQGVLLLANNVPQTRMFGHRYSNTQRQYTYNATSRTFMFKNLIPAILELIERSRTVYEQRTVRERAQQEEYERQRTENEACRALARESGLSEQDGDGLNYYRDRDRYRIVVYLNKYQIHKVLKTIGVVKSLVPANAGG